MLMAVEFDVTTSRSSSNALLGQVDATFVRLVNSNKWHNTCNLYSKFLRLDDIDAWDQRLNYHCSVSGGSNGNCISFTRNLNSDIAGVTNENRLRHLRIYNNGPDTSAEVKFSIIHLLPSTNSLRVGFFFGIAADKVCRLLRRCRPLGNHSQLPAILDSCVSFATCPPS